MKYFTKLCDFADEEAQWLNDLQLSKIKFVNKKLPLTSGMFFIPTLTVYYEPDDPSMEFTNIVHELRHVWQYKTMGKLKYLFMKAFCRKELEADAWNEEEKAIYWFLAEEVCGK